MKVISLSAIDTSYSAQLVLNWVAFTDQQVIKYQTIVSSLPTDIEHHS